MGFEKVGRRKKTRICDSDEGVSPVEPVEAIVDVDEIIENSVRKIRDGPDFLGTPKSSRLPRSEARKEPRKEEVASPVPSRKVTSLKLRPTPQRTRSEGETTDRPVEGPKKPSQRGAFLAKINESRRCCRNSMARAVAKVSSGSKKAGGKAYFPQVKASKASTSILDCDELNAEADKKKSQRPAVALVIKKRWCDQIFEGSKVWEIRGNALTKRGRICIAQSKSKTLVGEVSWKLCERVWFRSRLLILMYVLYFLLHLFKQYISYCKFF